MSDNKHINVVVLQYKPSDKPSANIKLIKELLDKNKLKKGTLVVCPELSLQNYICINKDKSSFSKAISIRSKIIPKKIAAIKIDEQKKKDYGLAKPKEDFSITSKIANVNKRGNYKIYITLENDQVWRSVKDIYDRTPVSKGQKVTISEGFMSGYVMKVEGKKTSLRVRRVK